MADDERMEPAHESEGALLEHRSASSLIFQGMTATGVLAGGLGGLIAGVKSGGGAKQSEQSQQSKESE
jgi:hypothetical protein